MKVLQNTNISEEKLPLLIKYRTYYKDEQFKKYNLDKPGDNVIVVNTNDDRYPFSKKLNKYWSEYALMKEIWMAGKKSEYIGFEQFEDVITSSVKLNNISVYYKKVMASMTKTVYSQYSSFHISSDMDNVIKILDKKYGEGNMYTEYIMNSNKFYYGSVFIMKWETFDDMCKFLFGVLDDLDKELGLNFDEKKYEEFFVNNPKRRKTKVQGKENYQMRAFGFLSERLVSAFIVTNCKATGKLTAVQVKPEKSDALYIPVNKKIRLRPTVVSVNKTNTNKNNIIINRRKTFIGSGLNW